MLRIFLFIIFLLTSPVGTSSGHAADPNNTTSLNTPEAKEQYRLFLKKLKELNSQYKQFTGEMTQVMKEEGTPSWDNGGLDQQMTTGEGIAIKEAPDGILVTVDLPGIQKDSIKLTVQDGNRLSVQAQRKTETETKTVEKLVQLPSGVDPNSAQATYQDGVLTLKLTKQTPQEISIPVK